MGRKTARRTKLKAAGARWVPKKTVDEKKRFLGFPLMVWGGARGGCSYCVKGGWGSLQRVLTNAPWLPTLITCGTKG